MSTTQRRIGRYELLEPVGRGAMGIVYKADDPLIRRTVAVKVLHGTPGLTPDQIRVARERFTREAQAAGGIDHPNIIRIFDFGEEMESGEMYIVMEYVPGPSLEKMLAEADLGLERAAAIIGQIASGLDAAHAQGVIHRDIKPSNILFMEDGIAKVVDFGITHIATSSLTQDMRQLGTPAYMSPEQVNGKALDSRADLFSLGVLSYEILSGRKPFWGTDAVSIAHAIAHAQPLPISVANPDLPRALDPVLERALAKEPSERFSSGKGFHEAVLACRAGGEAARVSAFANQPKQRPHAHWWLAGVIAAAVVASVVYWRGARIIGPQADTFSVNAAPVTPKTTPSGTGKTVRAAKQAVGRPGAPPVAAKPSAPIRVAVPTANLSVSLVHRLRGGTLIVSLDGAPIFSEKFSKSKLAVRQTTSWDPLRAPAGGHQLTARVDGDDGKIYLSEPYTLDLPRDGEIAVQVAFKGDTLTIKQRSS